MFDRLPEVISPAAALIIWLIGLAAFIYGLLPWTRDKAAPLTPGRRGWLWLSRLLFFVLSAFLLYVYILN